MIVYNAYHIEVENTILRKIGSSYMLHRIFVSSNWLSLCSSQQHF